MRVLFAVFVLSLIALISTLIALNLYVRKQQPLPVTAAQQEDLPQID